MTNLKNFLLPIIATSIILFSISFYFIKKQNIYDALKNLGASVISLRTSSSSSSGNPCDSKPCCGGVPYSGAQRCCNGVIYTVGYTNVQNPDGSMGSRSNTCCGGQVVEVGSTGRYTGTLCCGNLNQVKSYNKSHWVWSETGVGMLDPNKACGGCANQPNPPRADYCVQFRDAYMVHTPWNNQRCRYENPIWTSCGPGSVCNSKATGCQ